ncbi:MAG: FAD-binding oxidoreductase [Chloroflexota bacterium]
MTDLCAVTSAGDKVVLKDDVVCELKRNLRGELLSSSSDNYNEVRKVWNGMIDRRPALIARCAGAADVMTSVRFARKHDLLVCIRGGGHNVAGNAVKDGALMIDLSEMKSVRVDPMGQTVRAEPGVLGGDLDRETQVFGLATPTGVVSTTGIAGLTLGCGKGWLSSKYGFTIDNLVSADIVTADGELRVASATQNEDLLWALRGAGHNFGVVTSFEYQLHPVTTMLGGITLYPHDQAAEALKFYRDFSKDLPDEVTTGAGLVIMPDGTPATELAFCYAGDLEEGERILAPLRHFGSPIEDTVRPISYVDMQSMFDEVVPPGRMTYWKTGMTDHVSDEMIDLLIHYMGISPSPLTLIYIGEYHGASRRVGKTETAFYHRDLQYELLIEPIWTDPADSESNMRWASELYQAVEPYMTQGSYVNYLLDDDYDRIQAAYGENYDRLVTLKQKYDPTNFFRANQNIVPGV